MRIKIKSTYVKVGLTAFLVIACSLLMYFLLFDRAATVAVFSKLWKVFEPIAYGFLMAFILDPFMQFFEKGILILCYKLKKSPGAKGRMTVRAVATFGSVFLNIFLIYAMISLITPQLMESLQNISRSYPVYFANITHWLENMIANMHLDSDLADSVNNISNNLSQWISTHVMPSMDEVASQVTSMLLDVALFFKNIFLGLILAIYMLMIKERLKARMKRLNFAVFSITTGNQILKNLRFVKEKFGGFIIGKVVDSIAIGVICYVCMLVIRLPYPMLISVFIGVTNIIPVFGPFIGAIPSIVLILGVNPWQALYFIILILILQQFDGNFLGPKILGNSVGLSSFMVMLAILVGASLFGVLGMLLGVPVMAVITAIIQSKVLKSVIDKELPTSLRDYDDLYLINSATRRPMEKMQVGKQRSLYNIITSKSKLQEAYSPIIKEQSWELRADDVRENMDMTEWSLECERIFKKEKEEERKMRERIKRRPRTKTTQSSSEENE